MSRPGAPRRSRDGFTNQDHVLPVVLGCVGMKAHQLDSQGRCHLVTQVSLRMEGFARVRAGLIDTSHDQLSAFELDLFLWRQVVEPSDAMRREQEVTACGSTRTSSAAQGIWSGATRWVKTDAE